MDGSYKLLTDESSFGPDTATRLLRSSGSVSSVILDEDKSQETTLPDNILQRLRFRLAGFVHHFALRIITVLLVSIDVLMAIISLSTTNVNETAIRVLSDIILVYFCIDVGLRIFVDGWKFFKSPVDLLDLSIVVVGVVLELVSISQEAYQLSKLIRLLFLLRIIRESRALQIAARKLVSHNKRRYVKDGFDLDLTYIVDNIIAMSFPSSGREKAFRNPIDEVAKFFDTKHPDHYRIYNLCSERMYNTTIFHDRVIRVSVGMAHYFDAATGTKPAGIDDHNVPTMSQLAGLCHNIDEFLSLDRANVVAIHCKGGKGRTGCVVSAFLVYNKLAENAEEALQLFGKRRTNYSLGKRFQGVETPSQSRFVHYIERLTVRGSLQLAAIPKLLKTVRVFGVLRLGNRDHASLRFETVDGTMRQIIHSERRLGTLCQKDHENYVEWDIRDTVRLTGDFKIKFYGAALPLKYDECAFYFWDHTSFIENNRIYYDRSQLDNPHKRKMWIKYPSTFAVECLFVDDV